jgi:serine/threonine-protein kinase
VSSADDSRFAELAVGQALVSAEEVRRCRAHQDELRRRASCVPSIARLLLESGRLNRRQVSRVWEAFGQQTWGRRLKIPGYDLLEPVGEGAMSVVFRAWDRHERIDVAVKLMTPEFGRDAEFVARFMREAAALARLRHQNLVGGFGAEENDGLTYLLMEFVEGESLDRLLERDGRLPEAACLRILWQIAAALDYAHRQGIVHRDIKPSNIMLTPRGTARLCDLGLMRRREAGPTETRAGCAVGTPHYISPEQARGRQDVDTRSDLYSLGATLYRAAVGRDPFPGDDALAVMTRHVTEPLESPRKLNPALSPGFSRLLEWMMAKSRDERPPTARAVQQAIRALPAPGSAVED